MALTIDMFDNDERIILNGLAETTPISKLSKKLCLAQLSFSHEACADDDMSAVLDGLISKLEAISDEEWSKLRLSLPFEVWAEAEDFDILE